MFLLPKEPGFLFYIAAAVCIILIMSRNIYKYSRKLNEKKTLPFINKLYDWFEISISIPLLLMAVAMFISLVLRAYEIWMP
jgi:hypothetical protein